MMISVHLFSGLWRIPQHSCTDIICWRPWVLLYIFIYNVCTISVFRIFTKFHELSFVHELDRSRYQRSRYLNRIYMYAGSVWMAISHNNIFIFKTFKLYRSNTNYITPEVLQNVSKWCRYGYIIGFSRIMSPEAWATQAELYTMVLQYAIGTVLDIHHLRHTHRMYFLILGSLQ